VRLATPITFRSWCSGIGAPEQAWTPLGWSCLSTSEIDPQASAVLAHHHGIENLGDMTTAAAKDRVTHERARLFVAGTPCQSFSVAGLRKGMADPRGNLALVFLGLVDAGRPELVVWENVPGVLSSNGGRDFGAFLGGLGQLGYGWAYRVLDAQYVRVESHARAVPQRRRRVFVVGYLGDWRRAAAVLFERGGLCWNPPPRREAGSGVATALTRGLGSGGADDNRAQGQWYVPGVSPAMKSRDAKGPSSDGDGDGDGLPLVAHSLRAAGADASEDGTGRGTPIVLVQQQGSDVGTPDVSCLRRGNGSVQGGIPAIAYAIQERAGAGDGCGPDGIGVREGVAYTQEARTRPQAVAFQTRIARNGRGQPKDTTDALTSCAAGTHADSKPHVAYSGGVRRLMPIECERLQGFPDHYTQVPYKGKPMADAPRYRMLGNSMAVNVMSWIGQRIAVVDGHAKMREERGE
jgi:DNA (cytosine-5)-methyltransferase 1